MGQAFNIVRGRKIIDTVFYGNLPIETAKDIETALRNRGELPEGCHVTKVRRKMKDEYQMLSNYGYGWEVECTEDTRKELRQRIKEYRYNAPYGSYKMRVVRVPV
jgi:hypothetical protein